MKVSIAQANLMWEDKTYNLSNFERLIEPLYGKTDIIILPEMFNTGFSMNTGALSEPTESDTFLWMKEIATKGDFGLCGSYMVKEGTKFYNRWVFVSPENEYWYYDKRHLFSLSGEDEIFTRGETRLVFCFRKVRISPYICYDIRFPVWNRNQNDTDFIIYSANWPVSRMEVWNTLLKARAVENQCFVAGANRTGTDSAGIEYCGNSMILGPRGEIINSARTDEESIITGEISIPELTSMREEFPVLRNSDSFTINI